MLAPPPYSLESKEGTLSAGVTMGKGVRTRGRDLSSSLPNSLAVMESEVKKGQLQVLG